MPSKTSRILILTDSSRHIEEESLFPIARHLCLNPLIAGVSVADRADPQNKAFYSDLDNTLTQIYARDIDDRYALTTQKSGRYRGKNQDLSSFDAVWIRLDHPVGTGFLMYLRTLMPEHFMLNDPDGLVRTMSKTFLLELVPELREWLPKMALCQTAEAVETFKKDCPDGIVLKQVLSFGGRGVARYRDTGETDIEDFDDLTRYLAKNGTCLAMEYLAPPTRQSDNRVIIANGAVVCVLARTAGEGGWLCNLTSGGVAHDAAITQSEIDLAKRLGPIMRKYGIFLYGADMLLNKDGKRMLSEINTLNVGAVTESEELNGRPLSRFIADNLAAVIAARDLNIPVVGEDKIAA